MARYTVGFDGKWQESFDNEEEAVEWAREVAATGRTVEVIRRRFGLARFHTAFPESEREAMRARWRPFWIPFADGGPVSHGGHHYGHVGGGHGGGGHGGHHGGH